jgi:hypothetical protein
VINDIKVTLDMHYECETEWDIYLAARDVELLLNETYSMKTDLNTTMSSELGNGYKIKGNI